MESLLNTAALDRELLKVSDLGGTLAAMTEPTQPEAAPHADAPLFSSEELPQSGWRIFRKVSTTRAMRIEGAFRVQTSESENEPFLCEDGWLAIDSRGYPYAIAADEFAEIYREVPAAYEGAQDPIEETVRFAPGEFDEQAIDVELAQLRGRLLDRLPQPEAEAEAE